MPVRTLVAPLLEAAIGEVQVRGGRSDVRVQLSVEPPSLSASGDTDPIHRLVTSLLENAIRRSPGGGRVAVGAFATDDGAIELSVMDEGPGIRSDGVGHFAHARVMTACVCAPGQRRDEEWCVATSTVQRPRGAGSPRPLRYAERRRGSAKA